MWQRKNKFVNKAASRQIRGMPSRPGISTFGNTYRVVQPPSPSPQLAPPVPPQQSMLSAKRNAFAMSGNRNRADSGGSGSPYSTGRDKEPWSPLMSRSNDIQRAESGIGDERLRVKENDIDNNNCATHSRIIIKKIIRDFIGYRGVLFSDDLCMKALKGGYFFRAKKVIKSGANLVLICNLILNLKKN